MLDFESTRAQLSACSSMRPSLADARSRPFGSRRHPARTRTWPACSSPCLRANDLIWPYVVNNYLKGNTPPPFDLLYWNSDSTNLPGAMYSWYVRNTYLENNLRVPEKLTMCGVPLDLGRIDMPAYVMAAREDHIVPWRTAYATTGLLSGPTQFVLAASGHIAGVINPPARKKRNYWINAAAGAEPDAWMAGAASHAGSWWPHWSAWLAEHAGARIPAPLVPGSPKYPAGEPAPGRYVKD